jgi:hypothetical protein
LDLLKKKNYALLGHYAANNSPEERRSQLFVFVFPTIISMKIHIVDSGTMHVDATSPFRFPLYILLKNL